MPALKRTETGDLTKVHDAEKQECPRCFLPETGPEAVSNGLVTLRHSA
jgi:hypothetical protein